MITAYLVAIGAVLLSVGRLADMIGRKPIFIAGLVVFTLGSTGCGAAPSLRWLLAARAFQGLGAAMIFAVNIAMITQAFPPREQGRALGTNAILVALGISFGPTLGGFITQRLTWRWIFYVNVPVGLVVTCAAILVLTERRPLGEGSFDPAGAVLLGVGLAALTLGLSFGQDWGWTSWPILRLARRRRPRPRGRPRRRAPRACAAPLLRPLPEPRLLPQPRQLRPRHAGALRRRLPPPVLLRGAARLRRPDLRRPPHARSRSPSPSSPP